MKDRLMAVVAIATVAVIALAGVGYAAYSGIMTTDTGDVGENHLQVEWKQDILTSSINKVKWNSETTGVSTYKYKIADTTNTGTVQGTPRSANTAGVEAGTPTSHVQNIGTSTITVTGTPAETSFHLYVYLQSALTLDSESIDVWYSTDSGETWHKITTVTQQTPASDVGAYELSSGGSPSVAITLTFGITQTEDATVWSSIPSEISGDMTFEAFVS